MTSVSVFDLLRKVYGAKGIAFPTKAVTEQTLTQVGNFDASIEPYNEKNFSGKPIKEYTDAQLGKYEYMPVSSDDIKIPNGIIIISGEKELLRPML